MVGYIGPNGAGKSTTLRMLTGVLYPSSGQVRVCGLEPVPQRTRMARRLGVVFGQRSDARAGPACPLPRDRAPPPGVEGPTHPDPPAKTLSPSARDLLMRTSI